DTNAALDVFVHDRQTGATERVSVDSVGAQGNGASFAPGLSADGRFVAFLSTASNLVPGDTNGVQDVFVHDRLTGTTERVSVDSVGAQGSGASFAPGLSPDGRFVAFGSRASNLVPGDTNAVADVFVRGPDSSDTTSDTTGDGNLDDTVLEVFDTETGAVVGPSCPAGTVAVAGGAAAFLRPETAGSTPGQPGCPTGPLVGGNPDLNGDGDATDDVVHLWAGGSVQNLGLAASAVALSDTTIVALATQPGLGGSPTVAVHPVSGG